VKRHKFKLNTRWARNEGSQSRVAVGMLGQVSRAGRGWLIRLDCDDPKDWEWMRASYFRRNYHPEQPYNKVK